ncbi:MrcB family domain-containing protein [Bacillus pumilus]|uniref:MrcB family domain-containing protein n=1 Tax=Bacillus TaxID=1386 RepID=UPI000D03180E|nr:MULTISPECIES: DUF3578 domain-containing protein [Bacillus]MCK6162415.1 DUF3578 domain-containing protein [Bacillus pumilus]MCK6182921.1 DUF3578 domain-containing protein [Bacillus pumilus]PRS54614.1 DUF3578 domain-containing protein [Bacillus sp. LNXM10]
MREMLFNKDEFYKQFLDYKNNARTDKNHPFHKMFNKEIPNKIQCELEKRHMRNLERIDIKASTGNGKVAECFWIALLDRRLTTNPNSQKTTTQKGIFIVILFAENGEDFYLTIETGTENLSLSEIKEEAAVWRERLQPELKHHKRLEGFHIGDFHLGKSLRPKKYVASSLVFKKYNIDHFDHHQLIEDINSLNEFFYDFVYEVYLDQDLTPKVEHQNKFKRKRIIHRDVYKQLREERAKQNEETGRIAEKFVYHMEVEQLKAAGQEQLAEAVNWVAETEDGHGFDIKSYYPDGKEKLIEVKGSKLTHQDFPFFLSEQERMVAEEEKEAYVITLVESVGTQQMKIVKEIQNPLGKDDLHLKPTQYSCRIRVD